jgi:DNA processing protein
MNTDRAIPRPEADPYLAAANVLTLGEGEADGWLSIVTRHDTRLPFTSSGHSVGVDTEPPPDQVHMWADKIRRLQTQLSTMEIILDSDPRYPANLAAVEGKPALLFVLGDLRSEDSRSVAIVGSRDASPDAEDAARHAAEDLVQLGFTIVSGLARGVDSAAHRGAIQANGRTIAVVGTGIDEVFPPENDELAARIARQGAVVSQFPPGHRPTKTSFPARNAVIAGLSLGSLVIDAAARSGTRIEINRSLEQGRPVFLWAPLVGRRDWAQNLARRSNVYVVRDAKQIAAVLGPKS